VWGFSRGWFTCSASRAAKTWPSRSSSRTIDHGNVRLSILNLTPRFTDKQGQYLAFIYTYALVNRRPPAEADMQAFFGVTPPSVHRMVVELEKLGLIRRTPRQA